MKDATLLSADERFLVTTPVDVEPFADRDQASNWAMAVVLGGFALWAEVSGVDGPICRISGPVQPPQKHYGLGEALHTLPVMSIG
jgi:hypothetical protein